jgi:hypothetical protein
MLAQILDGSLFLKINLNPSMFSDYLPSQQLITAPAKIKLLNFIYFKSSCGGKIPGFRDDGIRSYRREITRSIRSK